MTEELTPRRFFPHHVSWLTIVLALLALGTFLAISNQSGRYYGIPMMGGVGYSGQAETSPLPSTDAGGPMRAQFDSIQSVTSQAAPQGMMAKGAYYPSPYP